MPTYIVSTIAEVYRTYRIEASSEEEAVAIAIDGDEDPRDEFTNSENVDHVECVNPDPSS